MSQGSAMADASAASRALRIKLVWIATLYFASGFPYGFINNLMPVYLRGEGAALETLTKLVSDVGWAWVLKPLWAPLVDRFGRRKWWIIGAQIGIALSIFALASGIAPTSTATLYAILGAMALISATQDIGIDAYSIEILERRELGPANGARVTAYRIAIIVTGGLLVALAGRAGWSASFAVAAGLMGVAALVTVTAPATPRAPSEHWIREPLAELLSRPGILGALLFVFVFKLGDYALSPLIGPFWLDAGFSREEIGFVQGTLGMIATIAGAIAGGWLTAKWGVFRALWLLGLVQALSNLGYWAAATAGAPRSLVYGAAIIEQLTFGLGTAAFLTYLMSLCRRRFAATQFALLSATFAAGRALVGRYSGGLAESLGYAPYFLLTFAMALPAFALLGYARRALTVADEREAPAS